MTDNIVIEYRVRPGAADWVSYSELLKQIAMWAMIPSAGPPAVTVSKRVTVGGFQQCRRHTCAKGCTACECTCDQPEPAADAQPETEADDPVDRASVLASTLRRVIDTFGPIGSCCFPLGEVCPLHH